MSDQEDIFEAECLNSAKSNRRALKRKAESVANKEIQKLFAEKEKATCERGIKFQPNILTTGSVGDQLSQVYNASHETIVYNILSIQGINI